MKTDLHQLKGGRAVLLSVDKGFSLLSPVFLSQYTLRYLSKRPDQEKVIIGSKFEYERLKVLIPDYKYTFYITNLGAIGKILRVLYSVRRNDVVIARGLWTALLILITGKRYIYDIRGSLLDEALLRSSNKLWLLKFLENIVTKRAIECWTVTEHLSELLRSRYPSAYFKFNGFCKVHPKLLKINDLSINRVKEERPVLVYSGGIAKYQCVRETLELWKNIKSFIDVRCVIYSKSPKVDFRSEYGDELLDNVEVYSVLPEKLLVELNKCHIGFLLRQNSEVNLCSSPVKFADYLVSGCKVVSTSFVGVVNEYSTTDVFVINDLEAVEIKDLVRWISQQNIFTVNADFIL